jgi:DNA helicase II / ATP-dependent DNA helicase PcrA
MRFSIEYAKELNTAQLAAVQSTEGPHLVIAGAGSGKTRVLVYRVAYLVEKGVDPQDILLLTFTRKASQEMLRRASLLLDERCQRVSGGTFHSFANAILRKYAPLLGFSSSFTILDQSDAEDTVNLIRTQLGYHKQDKRFPRKAAILEVISKSVNRSLDLAKVIYDEYPQFMEWDSEIARIRNDYQAYKKNKSLMDYDDLLVYLKELLVTRPEVRTALSRRYRYIMVDEYQDTNKLQAYIVCLLSSEHKNVMVVGDDSQSIYSFRGANFKNIIDFPNLFPGAKVIMLEENYRSLQPILNLTNEVIHYSKEKFDKNLFTRRTGGTLPVFVDAADEHAQSRYVADKILELRESGVELKDVAVLFRSGWHSNDLEVELASRNIPFVKYGGQKFVAASHIKDAMSYLRIIYNMYDEVSWLRLLLLLRGIGPKTAERVLQGVVAAKQGLEYKDALLFKHEDLKSLMEVLRSVDPSAMAPAAMLELFLKHYGPLLREKYDDYHKRINDLESLLRIAERYTSLTEFLTDMALEPPERSIIEAGTLDRDDSPVTLSTIHSAKGLEWHTVFLLYAAEGHLPSYLSLESEEGIEEERRLFYVATTRAKENLYMLKPHLERSPRGYMHEGGSVFTQASRFLTEGGIMQGMMHIESEGRDAFDEVDEEDVTGERGARGTSDTYLRLMKEYFEGEEG